MNMEGKLDTILLRLNKLDEIQKSVKNLTDISSTNTESITHIKKKMEA